VLRLSSEDAWSRAERACGSLRVIQARCAAAAERQNPLLIQGLRVRPTLRCPKAKRSQTVNGGPSGPSDASRAAAPLTVWGAEQRRSGLAYAFFEGLDARIPSNGGAPRTCLGSHLTHGSVSSAQNASG